MATIKDIADKAGVSSTTVSRVLNYDEKLHVSPDTRRKVFEAAETLSYVVKQQKRPQVKSSVGVYYSYSLEEELEDPYYLSIRIAIEKKLKEEGVGIYRIRKYENEKKIKKLDGIICLGYFNKVILDEIEQLKKPTVFVDTNPDDEKFDAVVIDFNAATKKALDYLIDLGHDNIGFIGGYNTDMYGNEYKDTRQKFFEQYLKEKSIYKEDLMKIGGYTPKEGYTLLKELLLADNKLTALFVANDTIAVGCYKAANELGIRIPEDISIIGFNDISSAQYMVPPLTTMKLYTEFMGESAVDLLKERITTDRTIMKKISIPAKLIKRESVKQV